MPGLPDGSLAALRYRISSFAGANACIQPLAPPSSWRWPRESLGWHVAHATAALVGSNDSLCGSALARDSRCLEHPSRASALPRRQREFLVDRGVVGAHLWATAFTSVLRSCAPARRFGLNRCRPQVGSHRSTNRHEQDGGAAFPQAAPAMKRALGAHPRGELVKARVADGNSRRRRGGPWMARRS